MKPLLPSWHLWLESTKECFRPSQPSEIYSTDKITLSSPSRFLFSPFPWANFFIYIFLSAFLFQLLDAVLQSLWTNWYTDIHSCFQRAQMDHRESQRTGLIQSSKRGRSLNLSFRHFLSRKPLKAFFGWMSKQSLQRVWCGFCHIPCYLLLKWKLSFLFGTLREGRALRGQITVVGKEGRRKCSWSVVYCLGNLNIN